MNKLVNKTDNKHAETGNGLDMDTNKLTSEIEALRKQDYNNFLLGVNSDVSEVFQGSSLFNYPDRTDINITWVVNGIASGMMELLITNPQAYGKSGKT